MNKEKVRTFGTNNDPKVSTVRKKSGGFQTMGFGNAVYRGVLRKGYKLPTPIQRKCIPLLMQGRDVVAMARTGSGKTAAFLLPLLERLKGTQTTGTRTLILSPTRELATQTMKFLRELGRYTGLRGALLLGGDSIESNFAALHSNPDVIVATPGRLLHTLVEMDFKLPRIEFVVFDEADRLFELGFAEQLQEILRRLPENRQTALFSATIPRMLADFAKAGLSDPELVRLDVETKLSADLQTVYLHCRIDDKPGLLLHLLRSVIDTTDQLTLVFTATKHHVEFVSELLRTAGIPASFLYSSLDATARKSQTSNFLTGVTRVLVVTDVAARGVDIPLLDNVVNFNFPGKSKLFVHRVGRVARAGRIGTAYSLVAADELPYFIDLHGFLGRPVNVFGDSEAPSMAPSGTLTPSPAPSGVLGQVPQSTLDESNELLTGYTRFNSDLSAAYDVANNAYKQYIRSRPPPSREGVRKAKQLSLRYIGNHPALLWEPDRQTERNELVRGVSNYKPRSTIFEVKNSSSLSEGAAIMRRKRASHDGKIRLRGENGLGNRETPSKDSSSEVYIPYKQVGADTEKGLSVRDKSFDVSVNDATMDITMDEGDTMRSQKGQLKWDRKRKRFVNVARGASLEGAKKGVSGRKIRTPGGGSLPASYKTDRYRKWLDGGKSGTSETDGGKPRGLPERYHRHNQKLIKTDSKPVLKPKELIFKDRRRKAKMELVEKRRQQSKLERNNKSRRGKETLTKQSRKGSGSSGRKGGKRR